MRSFDQSPSIVPPANDQDVYLVLDDFRDWHVQVWRETDVEDTDLETLMRICWMASTATPFASSPSTRRAAGREMSPKK